jgi:hypothetical protein
VAAGLVWTIAQSGELYGLDPTTGRTREQAPIGAPANHFPTPSVGDGLLLAPSADRVVAFEAKPAAAPTTTSTASTASTASTSTTSTSRHVTTTTQAGGNRGVPVAAITAGGIAALAAGGGVAWLILRRRRRAGT